MPKRLLTRGLTASLLALLLAPAAANAGLIFPEKGGSENADKIWTLYLLIFVLALIVFVGVAGALFWAMFKYRARKGTVAAQIHGNTRLEIGWTVGAFLILIFITIFTFITLPGIKNPPASDIDANGNPVAAAQPLYASTDQPPPPKGSASMNITVVGEQYVWSYGYPGKEGVISYVDMVVPVGMTITLDIRAKDVVHSWWIPKLGGKMDALPGYTNKTWFKGRKGVYEGQCAELCGRNHANMLARVRVVSVDEYEQWFAAQKAAIKGARDAQAESRQRLDPAQDEEDQDGVEVHDPDLLVIGGREPRGPALALRRDVVGDDVRRGALGEGERALGLCGRRRRGHGYAPPSVLFCWSISWRLRAASSLACLSCCALASYQAL